MDDLFALDAEDVDATDVSVGPAVGVKLDDTVTGGNGFLDLEVGVGVGEDRSDHRSYGGFALVAAAVGWGFRGFEHDVLGKGGEHGVEVVIFAGLVEPFDGGHVSMMTGRIAGRLQAGSGAVA